MAQPRVHEFAKEVGVPSKEVIAKLKDMGEFVKSSSSTLNPMVLKKLRAEFPAAAAKPAAKAAPAESAAKPAPKPAAAKPAAKPAAAPKPAAAKPAAKPAPKPAAKPAAAESAAPKPAAAKPAAKPAAAPKPGGPRPGNNPFASQQGMARPEAAPKPAAPKPAAPKPGPKPGPRPGNNPFASQQGMKRGGGDSQRSGGPRPARNGRSGGNSGARPGGNGGPRPAGGARPGGNGGPRPAGGARPGAPRPAGGGGARPNPSMMPKVSNVGGGASGSNNGGGNGGDEEKPQPPDNSPIQPFTVSANPHTNSATIVWTPPEGTSVKETNVWIEGVAGTKQTFSGPITSWNASPLEPVHQYTAVVELVSTGGAHREVKVTFTTGESVDEIDASFTGMTACPNGQECGSMTLTASRASQFQPGRTLVCTVATGRPSQNTEFRFSQGTQTIPGILTESTTARELNARQVVKTCRGE